MSVFNRPLPSREVERSAAKLRDWETRIGNLERKRGVGPAAAGDYTAVALALSNIVGYWRLGEASAPFADTSGFSATHPANLSVTAGATTALTPDVTGALPAGSDDGAVTFNYAGSTATPFTYPGDYLAATDGLASGRFDFAGSAASHPFTVAGWARPAANASSNDGYLIGVHDRVSGSPSYDGGWGLYMAWPGRTIRFSRGQASGGAGPYYVESGVLPADEWVHVAGSFDGTTIRLYIDGGLAGTTADTHTIPALNAQIQLGMGRALSGSNPDHSYPGYFYGALDEWGVWSRALTGGEIAALAASVGSSDAADTVLTSDGAGGTSWEYPTVDVDGTRYDEILTGTGMSSTDNSDGTVTLTATGGSPAADTLVWMPLVDSDGTCVLDGSGNLIPTLIPL